MFHTHFMIICKECDKVMLQCKCLLDEKPKYKDICKRCKNTLLGFEQEQESEENYEDE